MKTTKLLFALSLGMILASCNAVPSSSNSGSSSESVSSSQSASSSESISSESSSESSSSSSSESSSETSSESSSAPSSEESSEQSSQSSESSSESSVESSTGEPATGDLTITTSDGTYEAVSTGYLISAYGSYTLEGTLHGQILIDVPTTEAGSGEVALNLNGVSISYGGNSPIYCRSADKLKVKAEDGTENTITDERALESEEDETQGGGALYSKADTNFVGKGKLTIKGTYNNGVHVTKDLKIKNQTLRVEAPNNAIKGNNSITIESGKITAISTGGDGLKSTDSEVSSKGNQKGSITILGGTVNVYSACDGIDAAYDAVVSGGTLNIHTSKFSEYTGDVITSSETTMYLRTTNNLGSTKRLALLFSDGTQTKWVDATYKTSMKSGWSTTYYYYELAKPANYSYFTAYVFSASASDSTEDYLVKSSSTAVNSSFDTLTLSISSTSITTSGWTNYSQQSQGGGGHGGPGGMPGGSEGNSDKSEVSAKGIKAHNAIDISGGTITIQSYDDGIHASYGDALDNGSTGVGDVTISGGTLNIDASDDGVRAARYLRFQGGVTNVTNSYEGLEGNQIYFEDGEAYVYAKDDGVNASEKATTTAGLAALITVSGGFLDVSVAPNGDTDGIDSNGKYVQTGGTVIAKGPNSTNMAAVDTDEGVTISGGTLLSFGKIADTPKASANLTKSSTSSSYSAGTKTATFADGTSFETVLKYTYTSTTCYSDRGSVTSIQ